MCGGGNDSSKEIERQQLARQQAIQMGTVNIDRALSGFNDRYFSGVRKAALGTLMPQFRRQYSDAKRRTVFGLGDRGLTRSSAAQEASNRLGEEKGIGETLVSNQANQAVRESRADVERTRGNLTNTLVASQDPAMAAQQAVSAASSITAPSVIAPLGQLFQTGANAYLANRTGQLYNDTPEVDKKKSSLGSNYYVR